MTAVGKDIYLFGGYSEFFGEEEGHVQAEEEEEEEEVVVVDVEA